jgi:hypothetical protein
MLQKNTIEEIWHCHREIEVASNLIAKVKDYIEKNKEHRLRNSLVDSLKNQYGGNRGIEMLVPSNESGSSRSIYAVSPELALAVINSHIANKKALLAELNEIAKLEVIQ